MAAFPYHLLLPLASGATATIRILIYGLKAICFRFDEILTLLLKCAVSAALPRPDELCLGAFRLSGSILALESYYRVSWKHLKFMFEKPVKSST